MKYVHKTALNMSPVTFDMWQNTLKEDNFPPVFWEKILPAQITDRSQHQYSVCICTQTLLMSELRNVCLYSAMVNMADVFMRICTTVPTPLL